MTGPCAKQTTRATIIAADGTRYVGTNDCANPQQVCPRAGMPTGVGYELCVNICRQTGHAEVNAVGLAGDAARGSTIYLEGHYYACDNCKAVAAAAGVVSIEIGSPPASVDGSGEAGETPETGSTRRATARSLEAGDAQ
jgi:hypothetical protein